MKTDEPKKHSAVEVSADATTAVIDNLAERVEYMLTVTTITEEYFESLPEGHESRRTRSIPLDRPAPEHSWLPGATMIGMTSGTDPVTEVRVIKTTIDSVTIAWTPPVVYGSNRLQGTVVR